MKYKYVSVLLVDFASNSLEMISFSRPTMLLDAECTTLKSSRKEYKLRQVGPIKLSIFISVAQCTNDQRARKQIYGGAGTAMP